MLKVGRLAGAKRDLWPGATGRAEAMAEQCRGRSAALGGKERFARGGGALCWRGRGAAREGAIEADVPNSQERRRVGLRGDLVA